MSLLRDSFSGINARFHLVGVYTLIDLLLLILLAVAGDDADWSGAVFTALVLSWGATVGIFGLVFHAAAGRAARPPLATMIAFLYLPLLWLQIRLRLIVYLPFFLGAVGWHALFASSEDLQAWIPRAVFWCAPLAEIGVSILALFSTPVAILRRERGTRGAPIREGAQLMLSERQASARLLALLVPAAVLVAGVQYARGPDSKDPVPNAPEALAFLVASYLSLVVLYGACRVVLGRLAAAGGRGQTGESAATAPGPPA